jgi:bacterioferritin
MKGDPQVIELLNEALRNELTAVNQYWLHYRMLDNMGLDKLAQFERHESIDEMKHADRFAERILFLDGLPNFQSLGSLRIGENVEEMLRADLELELEALTRCAARSPIAKRCATMSAVTCLPRFSPMRKATLTRSSSNSR